MIVVRDIFQLRFGAAREAVALWREGVELLRRHTEARDVRILTDLTGAYYTLVLETSFDSLAQYEGSMKNELGRDEWQQWYRRFVPLVESGRREVFTLVGAPVPPSPSVGRREESKVVA